MPYGLRWPIEWHVPMDIDSDRKRKEIYIKSDRNLKDYIECPIELDGPTEWDDPQTREPHGRKI